MIKKDHRKNKEDLSRVNDSAFNIMTQFITTTLSLIALLLALVTFLLQQTPWLIVNGVQLREGEKRIYLNIENKGTIGVYKFHASYAVTSNRESNSVASDVKIIAFNSKQVNDEAIYPGTDINIIVLPYISEQKLQEVTDHIFLCLAIKYPRLQILNFTLGWKGEEVVFQYDREKKGWIKNTKTLLPDFFHKIFYSLKRDKQPEFSK